MADMDPRHAAAIDEHEANLRKFLAGELTPDAFRPLRLAMGVYAQLAHVKHMQRIKVPGGTLSAAQIEALAVCTERWGRGLAHVTTRQDVQLHHLELEDTPALLRVLLEGGLPTIGACSDTVRNVTASPYAGVAEDEVFDVTPHAHAVTDHFAFHDKNRKLPRKFKIGLTGSARDRAQVMINDLGFFAVLGPGGERGFRCVVAGGLGSTPEIAHLFRDFVPEAELFVACDAVVNVWFRDGERKNRKKARLKFLLRKLGEAEFLRRLDEEYAKVLAEQGAAHAAELRERLAAYVEPPPPPLEGGGTSLGDAAFARWKRTNTFAQKQAGYHVATIKLPLGDVTAEQLRRIGQLCVEYGNGEVRATNAQNLILRWVPERNLVPLHRELGRIGLAEPDAGFVTDVVSCPGEDYCSLAITKSMVLAARIRHHLLPEGSRAERDDLVRAIGPFEIKVSGCPNSCGQHHVADIGMTGLMVKGADGVERPHYSMRVGGAVGDVARIGDRLDGRIPEEETPKVVAALARYYVAERAAKETFREFVLRKGVSDLSKVGLAAAQGVL